MAQGRDGSLRLSRTALSSAPLFPFYWRFPRLRSFRQELYDDLGLRQDSLFELVDAVLTAPERRTLVRLSLCPCFRRRWPSTCDALADGTLDVGGLRALFQAHVPLPGPGERPLWALDGTHWPRPAAATSPARTWEHRPWPAPQAWFGLQAQGRAHSRPTRSVGQPGAPGLRHGDRRRLDRAACPGRRQRALHRRARAGRAPAPPWPTQPAVAGLDRRGAAE